MDLKEIERTLFGDDTEQVNKGIGYQPPQQPQQKIITSEEVDSITEEASSLHGVPKQLIRAIIDNESDRTPDGKYIASGKSRVAGHPSSATGLMQLINSTAKAMGVEDATDPKQNVMGGAKYLRSLMDRYNGDQEKTLAAYFKGPKTVDDWLKQNPDVKQLPGDTGGTTVADYIGRVNKNIQKYGGKLEGSSSPQLAADDINNPDYLAKILFGEVEPQQTQPSQSPMGQTQRSEPISMPEGQPIQQMGVPEQKKQLPFLGDLIELGKTVLRAPVTSIKGKVESIKGTTEGSISQRDEDIRILKAMKESGVTLRPDNPIVQRVVVETGEPQKFMGLSGQYDPDMIIAELESNKQREEKNLPTLQKIIDVSKKIESSGFLKKGEVQRLPGVGGVAQDVTSALGQVASNIGLTAINPNLAAASMITMIDAGTLDKLEEKGVSEEDRAALGLLNAALQYPLEKLGLEKITKGIDFKSAAGSVIKRITTSMGAEGVTEALQEIPDYLITEFWTKNKDKDNLEKFDALIASIPEMAKQAGYSGAIGAVTGGMATGAGIGIQKLMGRDIAPEEQQTPSTIAEQTQPQQFDIVDEKGNVVPGAGRNEPPPIASDNPLIGAGRAQQLDVQQEPTSDIPVALNNAQDQPVYSELPNNKPVLSSIVKKNEEDVKERTSALNYAKELLNINSVDEFLSLSEEEQAAKFNKLDDAATPKNEKAKAALLEFTRVLDLKEAELEKNKIASKKEVIEKESAEIDYKGRVVTFKGKDKKYKGKDVTKDFIGEIEGSTKDGKYVYINVNGTNHTVPIKKISEIDGLEGVPEKIIINKGIPVVSPTEPVVSPTEPSTPKEIITTEEQLKSVKEKVSGIEDIEFQGSNPSIEGKNKKTGEKRFVPPTFEFKDKVSGGNFTLKEEDVTPERINTIVEGLRKNVKPEIEQKKSAVEPVEVKLTEQASSKPETIEKPVETKSENKPVKFSDWHKEQEDKYGLTKNTEVTYNVAGVEKTGKFTGFTKSKTGDAKARISIKTDTGYAIASVSPSTIKGIKTAEPVLEQKPEEIKKEVLSYDRPPEVQKEVEQVNVVPTDAQKEAGNYKKGHIKLSGMDVSIENPAGSERSGKSPEGKEWTSKINHDYGYIRGTKGADAYRGNNTDQLDVFMNPGIKEDESRDVFIVNQKDPKTGKFDEHKAMIGFTNKNEAAKAYLSNYEKGWKGMKSIVRMPMDKFKEWAYSDQTQFELKPTGKEMSNEKEDSKKTETLLNTSEQRKPTEIPEAIPESQKTTSSNLVDSYTEKLKTGEKIKNTREILDIADKVYGGTIGEGKYGIRDAYDALETAMNKHIEEKGLSDNPKEAIASLNEAIKILPTQTVRTEDQVEKQQFSTPPSEAYLAVKASGIKEGMSGLEPSAGDGNIATMMRIANKGKGTIHVNEIDSRRRENLKILGFNPTNHDAEYLHSTLPDNIKPDVVVMNPPFSSTGGRLKSHDTGFGAEHVRQALLRLKEGGRLVAIVGNGMAFGKPKMSAWWNRIKKEYNVRANIGISGKEYEKYGTGFDNNIIVIDKTGPTENIESAITGDGLTVEQGYDKLEPLMKEDVYGRIKGNVSEPGKTVDEEKPKGSVRGETADIAGTSTISGSGRGVDTKQGSRAKPKPMENMGEPVSVGSETTGTVNIESAQTGTDTGTVTENEQGPVETILPESGSGDVGRPERKQERVQLKKEVKSSIEEESGGVYAKYKVKKAVYKGAVPHPANISESVTMASIEVPDVTYELAIPKNLITSGAISDAQLEAITYACQAHEQRLPNGMRKEYLIGDGTGMGKARTLLGIIYENSLRGKKKFVYITKSKGLVNQLKGDMEAMGINIPVIPLEKYKKGDKIDASEGILFGTYSTVSGDFSSSKGRYNQVLDWFGKDTDSVFVFDESHLMKNVSESYVPWGSDDDAVKQLSEGSQRGQMGVQFKKDLPNARFVNASATAATEPVNLAYLTRLGLWGEGTPFKDFIAFLNTMRDGGVGAMELLARDMKANGLYLARSISYDGVNYDTLNHVLAKDEKMIYNDMADFWSEILVKMEEAAKNANMKKESQRIMKQFYAAQQRFFLQLMMSFQVETMIKDADTKLKNGNSIVISLFNTNEQQTDKKVSEAINNGIDIDSMDFSPKDSMKQMIENNFPIYQYEEYNDEDGAKRVRQVIDPNTGEPLINKENLDMRQKLIDKIENFRTPENPIDRIVNHFGFEKVAEITGRKKRIVVVNGRKEYRDRAIKGVAQKDINTHELKQFMNGDKRVAIISGAAATGFDLHASLKKKNQQRRVFYALQLSWSADEQMQSFGRVHRTMQASAPEIVLVKTDIASQQRLINTIQSRLASLGAISKGERESLSGGIFSIEDITDSYGTAALGQTIRDLDQADLIRMNAYDKEGNIKSAISQDVSGFLNRIMVLPIDKQNEAFAKFYAKYRDNVEHAKQTGTFDTGVEKISGENIRSSGEPIVLNSDKSSGIKTELVTIEYEKKTNKELIQDRREMTADLFETKNKVSQRGYLYRFWKMDDKVSIYGPRGSHATISRADFMQKYEKATKDEVEKSWKEEYDKIPDFETVTTHLITGSIFPVYNKIFFDAKQGRKIKRATLNDGSSLIGVEVSSTYIPKIKQNFGIGSDIYTAGPQELVDLIKSGSIIELDNGWKISERRVMGEDRIELDPGRSYVTAQQMEGLGLFNEIIAFSKRYFIPTDNEKSISAMGNILKQAKSVRDLAAKTEDASAPIEMEPEKADYSAPLSPSPEPMPVKNIIETTKNAPHGKKVEYAVASNRIGKQMVAKKTGRGLSFLDAKNKFYQKIVDLTWPISQIEDQWADDIGADRKKIRTIDIAISKVRGAGGIAKQFIEDNLTNILDSVPGKIRSKIYTELNKYLIAKRTVWLYENKDSYIDAGISVEDARTVVEFVETGAHSYSEEINRIAPKMWEFNKKLLQVKRDHGVIDDELLGNLIEPYYVPFYRDVDENTKLNIPKGEKYTNIGKGIKRIDGTTSGAGIIEPLQNMMQNSYETFVNAYRADVMNKIIDFAESSPELGKMFEKVPPKWVKVGTIEYRGEVDMILRPKLKEFANKLGITVEEKPRVAGFVGGKMKKVLGKSAGNKIELMIGATESQFSHELGHQLHKKYSKWVDPFIDGFVDELNEVADTRYLGLSVPASYVSYCRNRNEKFAEFVSMYITDRENLQTIAPNAFMEFETRIALDNNLRELIGFKPSNVSGMMTKEKDNWVQDWHVPQDREVVSVLREGKIVSYRCPEEVADAIKNMHPAMFPTWFRIFTLPMSILRKGAVTLNIGFIIPNSVRDNQESAFNAGTIPVYDFLIGLKEYLTNGDMYKQYYRLGGGMDSVESGTRRFDKSVDDLKYGSKYGKFLDQTYWNQAGVLKGTLETGWAVLTSPFDLISKMGEASEMASRIGTYRRAVVGMPEWLKWYNNEVHNADEAIHIARQATVDFQRFGSYGRTANELIPFINAAIQGYDKMIRTIKDDPRRALLAAFLYIFGPMMAFWLWNKDKDGYKAVPLQDKINNFIIMNPDEKSWIKIPKGHIVKFIGNPVQITMEKIYGTVLKSDASIIKQVLSDVSPIDISSIPVSLRLIIEPIANYDLYWNREIEKPYHKAILQAGLRSDKKTAEAIKIIGKALNISPIMMQHEIEIVGAGTAKNILWLADMAMGKIDPARFGLEKMPVTKSFYGKIGEWGTDIDSAIIMVNKELAKTRSFSIKKMIGYSGYTPEEVRKISKANVEKIKLLYEKRNQLMKASEAIKHLRTTEE